MGVSRSGYYKWKNRDKSQRDLNRDEVIALMSEVHNDHPSHGYRWVAAYIRTNHGYTCSDTYIYKVFRYMGIQSQTKHKQRSRPRKVRDLYPNLIFTTVSVHALQLVMIHLIITISDTAKANWNAKIPLLIAY